MFWAAISINRLFASTLAQAIWGVMTHRGAVNKGFVGAGGSLPSTSSPAAAIWFLCSAMVRASSSTKGPRLVLMRTAVGFIVAKRCAVDQIAGLFGEGAVQG